MEILKTRRDVAAPDRPAIPTFINGHDFNWAINTLFPVLNVTSFSRSAQAPSASATTAVLSTPDSAMPIIVWADGSRLLWYCEAPFVYANESADEMFYNLQYATEISLSGIYTGKTESMTSMFLDCRSVTALDLSSFQVANVASMNTMFSECNNLRTITVSDHFKLGGVTTIGMFYNCTSLVGGAGTAYSSAHIDGTYARIDNPPTAPGYFTEAT